MVRAAVVVADQIQTCRLHIVLDGGQNPCASVVVLVLVVDQLEVTGRIRVVGQVAAVVQGVVQKPFLE